MPGPSPLVMGIRRDGSTIASGLARLGKRRLLLAIHDVSFPSDPDEDLGRGSPATRAATRLFAYAQQLGFTGLQLGPQGQTSRSNPSPYDGTIFARHLGNLSVATWRTLVPESVIEPWLVQGGGPARHGHAHDASHALLAAAFAAQRPDVSAFRAAHPWFTGSDEEAYGQQLVHEEHQRVRARCGLLLYGDLQVGYAPSDAAAYQHVFLAGYRMGAPPSRTNPEGQPWGYPVLDPAQYAGAARALVVARADKAFAEYDSLRIDHPHGLVCPWVYRDDTGDHAEAVRQGARLFESPDLPEHPRLASFAIARPDQLDRSCPRHADHWVRSLDPDQVARYAILFDALVESAIRHGRSPSDLSCEVLSTMPAPLQAVLARHGLGRWRVTQKANLDDVTDVYRAEQARREDWVMLGNHDTAPILRLVRAWPAAKREQWARHLIARLHLTEPVRLATDGYLATAMLAEILACPAENVSIFFADLFGFDERFNVPGVVDAANWSLRLPPDFARLHATRIARHHAIDLGLAVELALRAQEHRT